jgi:iron complex transport system permease protein
MEGKAYLISPVVAFAAAVLVLGAVGLLALMSGSRWIGPDAVWQALTAPVGVPDDVVVRSLRAPRAVLALTVGAALGVAGTLMQALTRNPLAEPGLFGVSAGAALSVVVAIRAGLADGMTAAVVWALLGALLATTLVVALSARSEGAADAGSGVVIRMAVIGSAVSAGLAGVTSAIVLLDARTLDAYRFWAVGSLAGRGPDAARQILPFVVLGLVLAGLGARGLDLLALGDDLARSLGVTLARVRLTGVVGVGLLTAAGVAACGPIAFLGLLSAQLARSLVGNRHRWTLPLSGLLGATVLVLADVLGRVVAGASELPAGVVLSLLGGPVFVVLVARGRSLW